MQTGACKSRTSQKQEVACPIGAWEGYRGREGQGSAWQDWQKIGRCPRKGGDL